MKKNRSTLKDYFKKGAIPTESNFADLIDSMLNQEEDNISKIPNDPLKVTALGIDEALLNFYRIEKNEEKLSWQVKQNPGQKPGLSVTDVANNVRFFIENGSGNVGLGTNAPKQALDVRGRLNVENGVIQRGGDAITNTSDLGLYSRVDRNYIRIVTTNAPIRFYTDGGAGTNAELSVETGSVNVTGALNFGAKVRQMVNLWNEEYAIGIQNATQYFRTGRNFAWYKGGTHNDNELEPGTGGVVQMAIRDGNVGIGTANPATKLTVIGNIRFGAIPSGSTTPAWQLDTGTWQGANMMYDGGADTPTNSATFGFHGGNSRTVNLRVDGNSYVDGSLGVGTTTPGDYKLNVVGNALFTGNYLFVNSESAGRLRVGAVWGIPGLYSGDDGAKDLALGVPSGRKVYLGTSTGDASIEGGTGNTFVKGNITTRKTILIMGTTDDTKAVNNEVVGGIGFFGYGVQHGMLSFRAGKGFELVDRSKDGPSTLNYDYDSYPYADLKVKSLIATDSLQVKGSQNIIKVATFTQAVTNGGKDTAGKWSVDYSSYGFTEIYSVYAVLQGYSLWNNNGNTSFSAYGHVEGTHAIPQHVYVRVTSSDKTKASGTCYCSESKADGEGDNTVLFTVVVMGRV